MWETNILAEVDLRFILIITLTILFNRLSIFSNLFAQGLTEQTSQSLRQQIEPPKSSKKMAIEGEPIYALAMLRLFYQRRNFMPAWNDQGLFSSQADILIKAIYQADQEGLVPEDYHLTKIGTLVSDIRQNISQNQFKENAVNLYQWAELDLLLTDSFLTYSSHLLNGRNNPGIISAKQQEKNPQIDLALLLQSSLETNRIEETLKTLLPLESGYLELRNALAYYRQVAGSGGWPKISIKQALKIGEQGEAVKILRSRLLDNSGLSSLSEDSKNIFDKELETAVIKLQKKHGLPANGVVDSATFDVTGGRRF